ncbi:hypothetical protein [Pseudanabaena sp. PCC 6802]|uniref:hypothetical protein n=1 Tax=Pseudanabaena sp. PCC 6802 TaxID=118173 RepID=UPI00037AB772|nr:hypothetical protein [Pseudanabaena sp. PCC 6802]
MGERFNTVVTEIKCWRNFTLREVIYDLSHLNAHWAEYLDDRDEKNPITYKFIVTYSLHCFTKESSELTEEELQLLTYSSPRETRPFNFERYHLSKQLPNIIKALGESTTLVCHAGYGKFATTKVVDSKGIEVDYFVVFSVFKESKKLRLHVQSAYPRYEGIGRIKKVSFFVIANNLLKNKKLPKL